MQLTEIRVLQKLDHPNVIKLKEVIKFNNELYFVFEYIKDNLYQVYQEKIGKILPMAYG